MSQKKITIPTDIDAVVADLNALGALITAKEWHRAAIVAAFVTLADGKGKTIRNGTSTISPEAFAALGITGLKSPHTVRRYVKIWESTGQPLPKPGHEISLPNMEWAEWRDALIEEGEITSKKATDYATGPKIAEAIAADPRIAEVAVKAIVESAPDAAAKIAAKTMKTDEGRKAIAKEMVKTGESASVEKVAADTRQETVRVFLDSAEGKAYMKGRKETTAGEESLKDRLARTGVLSIADMGLLLLSSLHAMEEFSELADSVGNRVAPDAGDTLREIGNRHKVFGQYLIDLADGKNPTKLSDDDLEALLTGGV